MVWRGCCEYAIDVTTGKKVIEVSPRYFRDAEVDTLLGDSTKARMELGWYPETTIQQMIHEMVEKDVEFAKRDEHLAKGGLLAMHTSDRIFVAGHKGLVGRQLFVS